HTFCGRKDVNQVGSKIKAKYTTGVVKGNFNTEAGKNIKQVEKENIVHSYLLQHTRVVVAPQFVMTITAKMVAMPLLMFRQTRLELVQRQECHSPIPKTKKQCSLTPIVNYKSNMGNYMCLVMPILVG
ncbi:PfhB2, partial [Pasteurella multocida subsp. multocida str. Anand1_buffalo]